MKVIIGCLVCVPGQEKDTDRNTYLVDNSGSVLLDHEGAYLTYGEESAP